MHEFFFLLRTITLASFFPGKPSLEYYAMPCTKMFILAALAVIVAFRAKMVTYFVCIIHTCVRIVVICTNLVTYLTHACTWTQECCIIILYNVICTICVMFLAFCYTWFNPLIIIIKVISYPCVSSNPIRVMVRSASTNICIIKSQ